MNAGILFTNSPPDGEYLTITIWIIAEPRDRAPIRIPFEYSHNHDDKIDRDVMIETIEGLIRGLERCATEEARTPYQSAVNIAWAWTLTGVPEEEDRRVIYVTALLYIIRDHVVKNGLDFRSLIVNGACFAVSMVQDTDGRLTITVSSAREPAGHA